MIRGVHALFYTSDPEATRAFLRDRLALPYTDVGEGWLIFDVPEGDVGVHPTERGGLPSGTHAVSFYCDDIEATVEELRERGVKFKGRIEDTGWGRVTEFEMPGGLEVQLYEPRYTKRWFQPATEARPKPAARKAKRAAPRAKARPKRRG